MPAKPEKSWREKLARDNGLPKVAKLDPAGAKRWGGKTLVNDFAAALYSPAAPIGPDGIRAFRQSALR